MPNIYYFTHAIIEIDSNRGIAVSSHHQLSWLHDAQVSGARMNILLLVSKRQTLLYAAMLKKYVELSW
jgi:hypothetical protein